MDTDWIVPKSARPGDDVVFFVWRIGFLASGTIKGLPARVESGFWAGKYQARVGNVTFYRRPLRKEEAAQAMPQWRWLRYPRSYTTPPDDVARRLRMLLSERSGGSMEDVDLFEVREGAGRLRAHLERERNRSIVERKKSETIKRTGRLQCEVCGFDFERVYGQRGQGFCEVHHIRPLTGAQGAVTTRLEDLAILCSNCHRMIHRSPLVSPEELRAELRCKSKFSPNIV